MTSERNEFAVANGISVIIPAAGQSRRMRGRDKLLEQVNGEALLHRAVRIALRSQAREVILVLRPEHRLRLRCIKDLPIRAILASAPRSGLAASVSCGALAAFSGATGYLILLPDMPEIGTDLINLVIKHVRPDRILQPVDPSGCGGHPVLFGSAFGDHLRLLNSGTPSQLLAEFPAQVDRIPVAGRAPVLDLDTPEDWQAWRNEQVCCQ